MSELVDRFGSKEDWRIFTEDEEYQIWEQFFGKRWSLNHIARNFDVRVEKIIAVIESPRMNARTPHSSGKTKLSGVIVPLPVKSPAQRKIAARRIERKAAS